MNRLKNSTLPRLTRDLLKHADALIAVMAADLEDQYQRPTPDDASLLRSATRPHDAPPRSRAGALSRGYAGCNGKARALAAHRDR